MRLIHAAAAVVNQTPLDWTGNLARISALVAQARAAGVQLLCLPELCLTGYGCEDMFLAPDVPKRALGLLEQLRPQSQGMVIAVGLPLVFRNGLFNTVAVLADGQLLGFAAKRFLAADGIHYEPRWFKPWPENTAAWVTLAEQDYPIGDLVFELGGVRLGFEICEDAWVANRPGAQLALRGVDIILNPSASHFAFDKYQVRQRFVLEGSRAFGVHYLYANLLGNEAGRAIYDGGALIASLGQWAALGPRLGYQDSYLTAATLDIDASRAYQTRRGAFQPALDRPGQEVRLPFAWNFGTRPLAPAVQMAAWETGVDRKEQEFTRAQSLALFDYLRKSHTRGCVVSLSGGADSAAVSCLVWLMYQLAHHELGQATVEARLHLAPGASLADLLLCVYQASAHSGPVTEAAAAGLAHALGAGYLRLDIAPWVSGYVSAIEQALRQKLSWAEHDLALQNIQARVRAPSVWLLANLRHALLLATSNRSEAAVGYATMDGDTAGGLSPLAGIDKYFLRHWLHWLETTGPAPAWAIPALAAINQQAPTAELRPPDRHQTDEADLMPYAVLDQIERAAIRDKLPPLEVYYTLQAAHPEQSPVQLGFWVERFFRLWVRNQWKRERYAPGFHLDDENLDPKTWCRFPILSGGFQVELAELRAVVAQAMRTAE